jgi:hypothetical protein
MRTPGFSARRRLFLRTWDPRTDALATVQSNVQHTHKALIRNHRKGIKVMEGCLTLQVGIERGGIVLKNIRELLPFLVGVLVVSLIFGWLAWYRLGLVVADAPVVVK